VCRPAQARCAAWAYIVVTRGTHVPIHLILQRLGQLQNHGAHVEGHTAWLVTTRKSGELQAELRPKRTLQTRSRQCTDVCARVRAEGGELGGGGLPNAGESIERERGERCCSLLGWHEPYAAASLLGASRRVACERSRRAHPNRARAACEAHHVLSQRVAHLRRGGHRG
jgi:hypothetical protein